LFQPAELPISDDGLDGGLEMSTTQSLKRCEFGSIAMSRRDWDPSLQQDAGGV
jgi:hypothetical protein